MKPNQINKVFFSSYIPEKDIEKFKETLNPTYQGYRTLEEKGYKVEINEEKWDKNDFGKGDVFIIRIEFIATLEK